MVIAIDPEGRRDYVPECDRELEEHEQTVFELRNFTARETAHFKSRLFKATSDKAIGEVELELVRSSLVGWRNLCTEDGAPVEFRVSKQRGKDLPTDASLSRIPAGIRAELAANVMTTQLEGLDCDDLGNS